MAQVPAVVASARQCCRLEMYQLHCSRCTCVGLPHDLEWSKPVAVMAPTAGTAAGSHHALSSSSVSTIRWRIREPSSRNARASCSQTWAGYLRQVQALGTATYRRKTCGISCERSSRAGLQRTDPGPCGCRRNRLRTNTPLPFSQCRGLLRRPRRAAAAHNKPRQ